MITYWHEDNWVKSIWLEDPNMQADKAGYSTDNAYKRTKDKLNPKSRSITYVKRSEWNKTH